MRSMFAKSIVLCGMILSSQCLTQELVEENGFIFEEHLVTTSDNYILRLFRIPGMQEGNDLNSTEYNAIQNKPPVLLQHGLVDSADSWLAHVSSKAPGFVLARSGYDVWFGNSRGNKYSLGTHVDINQKDYWAFSFEQMGDLDLPAVIDYILQVTKQQKLAYMGHSQGTSQMYYALAENENYFADKVSVFIALGPVIRLDHAPSKVFQFVSSNENRKLLIDTCNNLGINSIFEANWLTTDSMRLICGAIPQICEYALEFATDKDPSLDDVSRLQVFFGHYPSGSSVRQIDHYAQIVEAKEFRRYDYGESGNMQKYNQTVPPLIDITKISRVPIAMFVGNQDEAADAVDNEWAKTQLKTLAFYQEYALGHSSFFVAKDFSFFTTDVMNVLEKFHPANLTEPLGEPKLISQNEAPINL
ncbi:ab-hydrolase associated lipase region family protein [Stylonychia lemnae]|uniref:Lipase n=1 Tax=Stylonychia lemnae TaxID=5949 RepID=A0A078A969_STYLE|nr:ab-hydrolase associated lipase region family protein [Stylonychia lemnae]|eukprot:CDW78774.1 ab-hydrolase associated lipase region family protein [Stylonychia lemnae]